MNVDYFRESLDLLSYGGGHMLNEEQKALLEHSLIVLQSDNQLSCVFFWGRITAANGDYYVAFGYTKDALRTRRFYFSKNCCAWFLLPPANLNMLEASMLADRPLTGDISEVHNVKMHPTFVTGPGGNILSNRPEVRQLKEEDILALLVTQITDEAALLPRGALTKRMDGKTVHSPTFRGLRQPDACKLDNYALYRQPRNDWNTNLLRKPDYNYSTDIFDTVDDSVLLGQKTFALSMQPDCGVVLIRSLAWPGMQFFHKCGSRKHGFGYFGDGCKNMDLLHML